MSDYTDRRSDVHVRGLGLARVVLAGLTIATRLGNRRQHQFESSLEQLGREQRRTLCSRSLQRERTQAPLDFGLPGTRLDEVSFDADTLENKQVRVDAEFVRGRLEGVLQNEDLARYIL